MITTGLQLYFLVFCRIGSCLMLMPGFSSPRVPMRVRLFLALAVTLALAPIVTPGLLPVLARDLSGGFLLLVVSEIKIGVIFGLLARAYFLALQFFAVAITGFMGMGSMPGAPAADGEPAPAVASFIVLFATMLLFASDQHLQVIRAIIETYAAMPVAVSLDPGISLERVTELLSTCFYLALQISGPFIVYAISINFLFGIANKMIPQIPIYFISLPFVIAGGLFTLYSVLPEMMTIFINAFSGWLANA